MSARRETHNQEPRCRISKTRHRPAPVVFLAIRPPPNSAHFFPISYQPRAPAAVCDLLAENGQACFFRDGIKVERHRRGRIPPAGRDATHGRGAANSPSPPPVRKALTSTKSTWPTVRVPEQMPEQSRSAIARASLPAHAARSAKRPAWWVSGTTEEYRRTFPPASDLAILLPPLPASRRAPAPVRKRVYKDAKLSERRRCRPTGECALTVGSARPSSRPDSRIRPISRDGAE